MIACVCPAETVRSTPRSTSRLSPAASVTLACRSRISSVDMYLFLPSDYSGHVDEHVVAVDLHRVRCDRLGGRRPGRLAGAEVKAGSVQPALDRVVVHIALRQRHLLVRADVGHGNHPAAGPYHRHRHASYLEPDRARLG